MGLFNRTDSILLAGAAALTLSGSGLAQSTNAQDTAYIGMVKLVGQSWCPAGWSPLDGQLLSIRNNAAMFSLIGNFYGGDGIQTFALPDMRGRTPIALGADHGLPNYYQPGMLGGSAAYHVPAGAMPQHTHSLAASVHDPSLPTPAGAAFPTLTSATRISYADESAALVAMNTDIMGYFGGSEPVGDDTRPPYLTVTYCIARQGVFPHRN